MHSWGLTAFHLAVCPSPFVRLYFWPYKHFAPSGEFPCIKCNAELWERTPVLFNINEQVYKAKRWGIQDVAVKIIDVSDTSVLNLLQREVAVLQKVRGHALHF